MDKCDYIIVGAGSAGCVLANRLTENGKKSVILFEAGKHARTPWVHIPGGYYKTMHNSDLGWNYYTEPETELHARKLFWPRGRVLGGTSIINGMIYVRGQPEDYQNWLNMGNVGWGWNDVLPYFKKSEAQQSGNAPKLRQFHGFGGPLAVSDSNDRHILCETFVAAAKSVGIEENPDFNGVSQEGAGFYQITTRKGIRSSTLHAFLYPVRHRKNLRIITKATVDGIIIEDNRAVGVNYQRFNQRFEARAKEIILCGGAINSPKLLQLSGIGNAKTLANLGIQVVADIPSVGQNLQDHLQTRLTYRCKSPITVNDDMQSMWRKVLIGTNYLFKRKGPLANSPSPAGAFVKSNEDVKSCDLQLFMLPLSAIQPGVLDAESGYTLTMCLLRPQSRGEISIRSSDFRLPPSIRPKYLSNAADIDGMIRGIKLLRTIGESPPFNPYREFELQPGKDVVDDDAILDYIRQTAATMFHPVGTCRMGADPASVVGTDLRVRKVSGLRVADASIMPQIISGNTNAPTIMIAEKAADLILDKNSE